MEKIKEIFEENKITIVSCLTILILSFFLNVYMYYFINDNINNINDKIGNLEVNKEEIKEEEEITYVYVDIKGEIKKPGTYKMNKEDRVIDVIEKAGGLTSNASTIANNLSKKVTDEMVIIIYSKNEIKDFSKTKELEESISSNCNNNSSNYNNTNSSCIEKTTNEETKNLS